MTTQDLSHPDHIFADWLQDHDDPRHAIVRGDLQLRGDKDSSFFDNIRKKLRETTGTSTHLNNFEPIDYPEHNTSGIVSAHKVTGPKGTTYWVKWYPKKGRLFDAIFNSEEMQELLNNLNASDEDKNRLL